MSAISCRMLIIASQNLSSSALSSDSVGSIMSVPATGQDMVGAWNPAEGHKETCLSLTLASPDWKKSPLPSYNSPKEIIWLICVHMQARAHTHTHTHTQRSMSALIIEEKQETT
jgi:hypothetical protein